MQISILAVLCALVSIVFCILLHKSEEIYRKLFQNPYIRIFAGLFIMLSLALGVEGSPLFVSKWALAFTAFVGLNLFQFGFTNFCPLAIILKKLGVREGVSCSA